MNGARRLEDRNRAYLYSEDEGRLEKFRPCGLPPAEWLAGIKEGGVMMQSTNHSHHISGQPNATGGRIKVYDNDTR